MDKLRTNEIQAILQAFEAAGSDHGVLYLSTPITTGLREYELMAKLDVTRAELRAHHRDQWVTQVLKPNERDALLQADLVTETLALGRVVINPTRIVRTHWDQSDYDILWRRLITEFPVTLIPLPGWEFSRGACLEVILALSIGLPIVGADGEPLSTKTLEQQVRKADQLIVERSWDGLGTPLPAFHSPMSSDERSVTLIAEAPEEADARRIFTWLVRERNYQINKFGVALDDEHTRSDGLSPDGWWSRQLEMYFHRAGLLGLEHLNGRQALAKYVATACGMLESVTRIHGSLPPPGVPSGDLGPPSGTSQQ